MCWIYSTWPVKDIKWIKIDALDCNWCIILFKKVCVKKWVWGDILGLPPCMKHCNWPGPGSYISSQGGGGGGGARNENHSGSGFWFWRPALCNTQAIISAPQWNFSARILAQLAELDPHMHFSPMKSPGVGAEGVIGLLHVHRHQLPKVQDPPPPSGIHRWVWERCPRDEHETDANLL